MLRCWGGGVSFVCDGKGLGGDLGARRKGEGLARSWGDMQVANRADTVKAVLEGGKSRGLREEHQEAVEALV